MISIPDQLKVGILENLELIDLNNVYALALEDFKGWVIYVIQKKFKSYEFRHKNSAIIKSLNDDIIKTLIDVRDTNKINYDVCGLLSESGRLECLRYAHENGYQWNEWTCKVAAIRGHLDCLKYAHENGCPWNNRTCEYAAQYGNLDCLKYAHENGCPWDEWTCTGAAYCSKLECLKYAHENGCPYDKPYLLSNASLKCRDYVRQFMF